MKELANLIMVRYYLSNELGVSDVDLSEKEVELFEKALKESGNVSNLKAELDDYIKSNDWTGLLGEDGSGRRERELAIEGCIDYAEPSVRHESDNDELFESIYREAIPRGYAVVVDGKVWDNGLEEDKANKLVKWLIGKNRFKDVHTITPKGQDVKGIKNWTRDEKQAIGF